jgi:hypothetical protein
MKTEIGLEKMCRSADRIAAQHLDFIKTSGEKGRSAMADMAEFEELEKSETNKYLTFKTEYFILSTLTRAMQKELIKMEEEKN